MQAGYTMNDRLLRPSMVGVSKKKVEDSKSRCENNSELTVNVNVKDKS